MIYIKFGPGTKIILQGHAEAAPKGEDIICAGVSTLYYTFYAACDAREVIMGNVRMLEADSGYKNRAVFDAVKKGLGILASKNPKHVKILKYDKGTSV